MTAIGAIGRAGDGIASTVRDAAERTGVDFSYLLGQARVESGLNPQARAATSSARGLFQFTAGTWLDTVRRHGAAHGLGWAADALASGAARAGTAARAAILALRDDAGAAALMAGEFARDNAARLETSLGRAAGGTDLYLAHFLGAGGAAHFLKTLDASPGAPAADVAPAAARTNHHVFYARDGMPRSVAEVYARFASRLGTDGAMALAPGRGSKIPAAISAARDGGIDPRAAAQAAYRLLAELGG